MKKSKTKKSRPLKTKLLAGGNPQVAKGDGDGAVQSYIAKIPVKWKREIAANVDSLVTKAVPKVKKAVKWNSPFYGVEGQGWFLSLHCFTRYVKLTFFKGGLLKSPPPGESKHKEVRHLDIHEGDEMGKQLQSWIKQASKIPGWLA